MKKANPFPLGTAEKVREFMDSLSPKFILNAEGPQIEFSPSKKRLNERDWSTELPS